MNDSPRHVELLAPARDLTCGVEAIRHGADAVYIGAPRFGARAAAGNSVDDIRRLCDFAHPYGAKVYVTLNTLIYEDELAEAERLVHALYRAGVDALITQDLGLLEMDIPPIPLHASTQMDNRDAGKARFLERVGFSRIVLARELTLAQIREIAEATSVPLEVFVHGALCVSYSGQCYLSAALSGRSANRGECAQYCRLPYTLVDADGRVILKDKHLLSLKDMNRGDRLEELLDAGVTSLKIEGRMKDVSYVKNVTAWYRQKLDALFARRPEYRAASAGHCAYTFTPDPRRSFNRGFTPFYLDGRVKDVTSFDTPKSQGQPIGRVRATRTDGTFHVSAQVPLSNGDGLTYFNGKGELVGFRINRIDGDRIHTLEKLSIAPGTPLYRNYDQAFEKILAKPSAQRKLNLRLRLTDTPTGFSLEASDETGARVVLSKPFEKTPARVPQTERIRSELGKLGDTLFQAERIEVALSADWFIPASFLADLRRETIDLLLANQRVRYPREVARWKQARQGDKAFLLKDRSLSYRDNVANSLARRFYKKQGAREIAPAFEVKPPGEEAPLMYAKHCLRYSLGWCPRQQAARSPYREPYYLCYKETRLRLQFDCQNCQMLILADKRKE